MCDRHHPHPRPFNCIVPPHMLQVLAQRAEGSLAKEATDQLQLAERTREERQARTGRPMQPDGPGEAGFLATPLAPVAATRALVREIYDGGRRAALPGRLVRSEGAGPTGDAEADTAYDCAGTVYDLYFGEFNRNSLDGAGMKLVQTVHHRRRYNNAFWNGQQMAYGDGDGRIFVTFTELSVVAHEMTHGVVQFSGGLIYQGQSGALNESFADVFGAIVRQYASNEQVWEADWLIGKGILGPTINGVALRSMKAPGTAYNDSLLGQDPQPYHMDLYVDTTSDNGGVHINSGIPNHAFYLYCQYMGGVSWGAPGQVWYDALQRLNNPLATFIDWATATVDSAIRLYGLGTVEVTMLRRAWRLVGIQV